MSLQNLGVEFQFKSDEDALQSIIENIALSYSHTQPSPPSLTPAKFHPNMKHAEDLEFFEGINGNVFFRRKITAANEMLRHPTGSSKKAGFGLRNMDGKKFGAPQRLVLGGGGAGRGTPARGRGGGGTRLLGRTPVTLKAVRR